MNRLAVIIHRMGPYHIARLNAAGRVAARHGRTVFGIEIAGDDATYAWQKTAGEDAFERCCLFQDATYETLDRKRIRTALVQALDSISPDAVALPGWAFAEVTAGLTWAPEMCPVA